MKALLATTMVATFVTAYPARLRSRPNGRVLCILHALCCIVQRLPTGCGRQLRCLPCRMIRYKHEYVS
eukprot:scaffold66479_cov31-Prasinocladus_malaysianus.AAC.3